jgi:hypothetical protein
MSGIDLLAALFALAVIIFIIWLFFEVLGVLIGISIPLIIIGAIGYAIIENGGTIGYVIGFIILAILAIKLL